MEELTLFDGVIVRLEPVPGLAASEVVDLYPELANPPLPLVEHVSKVGKKKLPAKEGEPAYAEWLEEVTEIEKLRGKATQDFTWDVGVVEWSHDNGETWTDEAPKDWSSPGDW